LQSIRLAQIRQSWCSLKTAEFTPDTRSLEALIDGSLLNIQRAADANMLLLEEARLTKGLFKLAAQAVKYGEFTRAKKGEGIDTANGFLDHGNYLAYGLGATATWVLGLPHGLAVLHGKTRRGGLVFDIADLVKDALILPQAFICAMKGSTEQEFRHDCLQAFARSEALDFMIDTVKELAMRFGSLAQQEKISP
jgi:CRISPR-associated protein Cas1